MTYSIKDYEKLPKSDANKAYNYVMEFSSGMLKIGFTTNPGQRMKDLDNSNSGGFYLTRAYFSEQHYCFKTYESFLHEFYKKNRVNGEFFVDLLFDDVVAKMKETEGSESFKRVNKIREEFTINNRIKGNVYKKRKIEKEEDEFSE